MITEHWLREDNINLLRTLPGYKLAAYYGRETMDRGGAGILVRNHIECVNRPDIDKWAEPVNFEISCTELVLDEHDLWNIIIIAIYRTPNSNPEIFFEKLESILHKIHREAIKKRKKIIIGGDFNINVSDNNESRVKERLLQLLNAYNISPNFKEPTRITATSATCIDNIFTNFQDSVGRIIEPCLSDHTAQIISFTLNRTKEKTSNIPNLRRKF